MTNRYAILPMAVFQDERLSKTDIRILGIITAHANKKGVAWPSRVTIAKLSGCILRNITRSTNRIIKFGYLSKVGKVGRATKYELQFDTSVDGSGQNKVFLSPNGTVQPDVPQNVPHPSKMSQGDADPKVSQNVPNPSGVAQGKCDFEMLNDENKNKKMPVDEINNKCILCCNANNNNQQNGPDAQKMQQNDTDLSKMQQNDTHDGKCVEMSPISCPKMAPMGVNLGHPIGQWHDLKLPKPSVQLKEDKLLDGV